MDEGAPTAPTLSAAVASEIRGEMARRGLLQSTLAERLNEHPTWVSRRIAGRIPLDLNDLERIAGALDVDPFQLLDRALDRKQVPA